MKVYLLLLMFWGLIIFSSCKVGDNLSGPSLLPGKFIVDSVGTAVLVKNNTLTNHLRTYITLSIIYHYKNYLGELNSISLYIKNSYGVNETVDYLGPDYAIIKQSIKSDFQFPVSLAGQNNVRPLLSLNGTFWIKSSINDFHIAGNFFIQRYFSSKSKSNV